MTECFPSPPPFNCFGNKRLSSVSCYGENIGELSQSVHPFKRQRNSDAVTMGEERVTPPRDAAVLKRGRMASHDEQQEMPVRAMSHHFPSLESQVEGIRAAVRAEYQAQAEQGERDMQVLRASLQQHEVALSQSQTARATCEEENRILKRAVAIQDGRQKELAGQNQQLQQVLAQAAEHVANLERVNRELRSKVESNRGQYSFHTYDRPPDVF